MLSMPPDGELAELLASVRAVVDADLAEYFASAESAKRQEDGDGFETPNSGDDDAAGQTLAKWANSVSPLRGKAPLSLSHRNSVQRRRESASSREVHSDDGKVLFRELLEVPCLEPALGSRASFDRGSLRAASETGLREIVGDDVKQCLWLMCFDLLSALRGIECSFFSEVPHSAAGGGLRWMWAKDIATGLLPVPPSTFLCVNRILEAADRASQLRSFVAAWAADSTPCGPDDSGCMEDCGRLVLSKFYGACKMVLDCVDDVLVRLQEDWAFAAEDPTILLAKLASQTEESCCFLLHVAKSASLGRTDVPFSARAARLVDVLTLHAARAQANGNRTLQGKWMSLLLMCIWPYCELFVPAMHGDHQPIDRTAWLQSTPKVFRTSFKVRGVDGDEDGGDNDDALWTDALALVVSCEGIADKTDRRARHSGVRADLSHLLSSPLTQTMEGLDVIPVMLDPLLSLQLFIIDTPLERGYRLEQLYSSAAVAAAWRCGPSTAPITPAEQRSFGEGWRLVTLDTAVPLSHWLTVNVLLPIASIVQSFHKAHLCGLLKSTPSPSRVPKDPESVDEGLPAVTFSHALGLVRDVVLCAAWEQVVDAFLDRATAQSQWWYRSSRAVPPSADSPASHSNCTTASKHLSAHFADAIRPLPLGRFVKLVLLPNSLPPVDRTPSAASEIISTFDAMRLVFSLPESIGIVLTPQQFYGNVAENFQNGDPYSRMFSFLCSFAYTKKVLLVRWKEQHHAELRLFSGVVRAPSSSRGDGTNNHQLAFLCDTVLRFTQREALTIAEQLRLKVERGDPRSVSAVCQFVDAFQAQLGVLCATPSSVTSEATFLALKKLHAQLLRVALDHDATAAWTADQIRVVAGGLVATLESLPEGSAAGSRLRPVLLQLTFNRYY